MSDQTPDTPPDPWVSVRRHTTDIGIEIMEAVQVDIARAQVEAQHAEELDELTTRWAAAFIRAQKAEAEVARLSAQVEAFQEMAGLRRLMAIDQENSTLRAERDAAHQEIASHRLAALEAAALLATVQGENARLRAVDTHG
mgnify:CR=1 FL=1